MGEEFQWCENLTVVGWTVNEKWGHGDKSLWRGLAEWRRVGNKANLYIYFLYEQIINTVYSVFIECLFTTDLFSPEIAVNQLDQLSPEEQLLVKCAAVIGHCFRIDLLQHLLPGWDKHALLRVLRALVDVHMLRWCNMTEELAEPILVPSSVDIIGKSKEEKKKSGEEVLLPCSQAWMESLEWGLGEICVEKEHQYHTSRALVP